VGWIVAGAWLFAIVFAVVVLGFVAYELRWKSQRLMADRDEMNVLVTELNQITADLQAAGRRAATLRSAARSGDSHKG